MRILHVSLGLPPLRTGGLTRYCTELMESQVAAGNVVMLLYPGHFSIGSSRIHQGAWKGIVTYELINPLPVALTYGVANPKDFMRPFEKDIFVRFLSVSKPDVVHVHSFMGIPREFFEVAKDMGIRQVFTTHDYYPICPRCTFVNDFGHFCKHGPDACACALCNSKTGMSLRKSKVMQAHTYARLKNTRLVHSIGSLVKHHMSSTDFQDMPITTNNSAKPDIAKQREYAAFLSYNKSITECFDVIICNSTKAREYFRKLLPDVQTVYLPITHDSLEFTTEPCHVTFSPDKPLEIGYFGGNKAYKGIDVLMAAMVLLDSEHFNYKLHLYGEDYPKNFETAQSKIEGHVDASQVQNIMSGLDVVIVPSIWPETFCFVVLEAICAGTPVICADTVGASDLVVRECIYKSENSRDLFECIVRLWKRGNEGVHVELPKGYPVSMEKQVQRLSQIYSMSELGFSND